jgi:LPS sulfotransferase NodH
MSLLDSHQNIECAGEIFKDLERSSSKSVWFQHFGNRLNRTQMVGFRLFYYHPFSGDNEVWKFLKSDPSIVIIHLSRRNVLRTLISQRIGMKTNLWKQLKEEKAQIPSIEKRIHLSVSECEEFFAETKKFEIETRESFAKHAMVEVVYEEMISDPSSTLNRIFKGINLSIDLTKTNLKKQNPETLSELCENYQELKKHFENSEWAVFFGE